MGSDTFDQLVATRDDLVTVFHNITPARFFSDETTKRYVNLGRQQLATLAYRSNWGIADSNFNRKEMVAAGFRRVDVIPVKTKFRTVAPGCGNTALPGGDWLFVGRVVPNKGQLDLVHAYAAYCRKYGSPGRLLLVGDLSSSHYVNEVHSAARHLGVERNVVLTGKLTDDEVSALFRQSGLYLSLSEHEGFGVPLLEAMAAGLPVIARDSSAVAETMGGAGVCVSTKDSYQIADLAHAVNSDSELRGAIIEGQFRHIERLQSFDLTAALGRVLDSAAGAARPLAVQVQGPFETNYSLANLNRNLAVELSTRRGLSVTLHTTEGPGDYTPRPEDLARFARAAELYRTATPTEYPDIVIRQMWPPRLIDSNGGLTFSYFGWEESVLTPELVENFNRHADGIGVMSDFVKTVLRDSGVAVPIRVVGVGVEPHDFTATFDAPELKDLPAFRFLNIGSAFPRKGVDLLIEGYFAEFDGEDDVALIIKSFPNEHNNLGEVLARRAPTIPTPRTCAGLTVTSMPARCTRSTTSLRVTSTPPGARDSDCLSPRPCSRERR